MKNLSKKVPQNAVFFFLSHQIGGADWFSETESKATEASLDKACLIYIFLIHQWPSWKATLLQQ